MKNILPKIGQFLEKNIEWFCLGIGVLFALWCVWSYLLTPVSKKMGSTTVTLDSVETKISEGSAAELKRVMDVKDSDVPVFKVQPFSDTVKNGLAMADFKPPVVEARWDFQPAKIDVGGTGLGNLANGPKIKQLPVLPKLNYLFLESGMSTVDLSPAAAPAAPGPGGAAMPAPAGGVDAGLAAPPAAAPATGAAPAPGGAAAPGAAAAPGGAAAPGVDHSDINWVTIAFSLPSKALSDEWKKAYGPEKDGDPWKLADNNTEFLSLTAYRSEKLADGKWGPEVEVARLPNNPLTPYPPPTEKLQELSYADWAKANGAAIVTPPIPPLAPAPSGAEWKDPASVMQNLANPAAPAGAAAAPAAAPAPAPAPIGPLPVPARGARGAAPAGRGPAAARGRAGATPPPADAPAPDVAAAPAAGAAIPAGPLQPDIQKNDALGAADMTAAPVTKDFNPYADKQTTPDLLVYLHDNVQPGKTYRYRMGYRLYNPAFNFGEDKATDKTIVAQFALEGPRSEWTKEIAVAPRTYFFCAQTNVVAALRGAPFSFEVITWSQGLWHKQTFSVSPGDQIGGVDNGIDYGTGYTFIEARYRNARQTNVLIADADGNVIVRAAAQDASSPDKKAREALVPSSAAPATPAAPAGGAAPAGANPADPNAIPPGG